MLENEQDIQQFSPSPQIVEGDIMDLKYWMQDVRHQMCDTDQALGLWSIGFLERRTRKRKAVHS
jgi:hypothetical protein